MNRAIRKLRRAVLRDEPGYYDMYENPGERFFARLYLHQIRQVLQAEGGPPPLTILDAGCQSGRLAVPLSADGHHVTGVDTSGVALRRARRHAQEVKTTLRLIRANLTLWLPTQPTATYDAIVCTEVLYLRENHQMLLKELIRVLKPGGLCFISHRPTGYHLAEAFQRRDWEAIQQLTTASEGVLWGSYYNWYERRDLEALYPPVGVKIIAITPIGFLSWLAVNPADLDEATQERLFQIEIASHDRCSGSGRYLLVSGKKL